jgi:hypothetical protein
MGFDNISVRPYCKECKWWHPVNLGSKEDALQSLKGIQARAEVEETNMV